jgi:tRNA(Ile)-lysidine synthase
VGFSGGLDSTVLLHALASLRHAQGYSLSAVHVHHGLSPQADSWAGHCRTVCAALDIPLSVVRVHVRSMGHGLEAAARQARYRVFTQLDTDALALAHHADDQAETVLLQLLRGATVRGMAAMPEARPLTTHIQLLRPFLGLRRARLQDYARAHGLAWVEDESNLDPSLARNRLRHTLLPPMEAALPGLTQALARSAVQCAEWADLLDALADLDAAASVEAEGLAVARLQALPQARGRNLLRRVLEQAGVEVRRQPMVEAMRQLCQAGRNAQVRVDFGELSVVRFRDRVQVVPQAVFAPVPFLEMPWHGEALLELGTAGRLRFSAATGEGVLLRGDRVVIRHRRSGDRLRLRADQPRRPLKDLLREAGMPTWQRPWLPLVEVDGQLAWVAGLGATAEYRAAADQPGWFIAWQSPW